jgi:exonuclease VII small subunit
MPLRTDLELALEGFRSTLKKLDNDIRNLEDDVHNLEETLDMHLNGVKIPKRSDIEGLKAVSHAVSIPSKPIGELK